MKKFVAAFLAMSLLISCAACSGSSETTKKKKKAKKSKTEKTETTPDETEPSEPEPTETGTTPFSSEPTETDTSPSSSDPTSTNQTSPVTSATEMTLFIALPGTEINADNDILTLIAEETGVYLHEMYNNGTSTSDAISKMKNSGNYADYFYGWSLDLDTLLYEDLLLPLDDYLDDPAFSNIRNLYTDAQWEMLRQADGHIYWIPSEYPIIWGEDRTKNNTELKAFWIQARVLEWAGYPKIETLDQYFELLESYYAEHKTESDGTPIIPYTMNTEGWRDYALEEAPQMLDGYANNGSVIVDAENYDEPTIIDYNTSPTAKKYFQTLNTYYHKGIVDPNFDTQSYDDYLSKLSSGTVLGMYDAQWDFQYVIQYSDITSNYVPLPLTIEPGMENHYYRSAPLVSTSDGICICSECKDVDLALYFLNRCLDQDIHDLRFWGVEDQDFYVDDSGLFCRTPEMIDKWDNAAYLASHVCRFPYLPSYSGTSRDGINAMRPEEQTSIFFATLPEDLVRCFNAYGYESYCDFMHSSQSEWEPWFPMYTYSNMMGTGTRGGVAFLDIKTLKHTALPALVKSDDFEKDWDQYMEDYAACHPEDFLAEMEEELQLRIELAG
ncbi:MAG: sugar ABC transporter substrate-binding protein [Clostridiales bacterium]|nr:sugar ABC transporter substrate-binding protein [Clostridiales bacterium]